MPVTVTGVSYAGPSSNLLDRIDTGAPWARRLSATIAIAAGVAAVVVITVILLTVVVGRLPWVPFLLIPGVPLLGIGQLWCITILLRRANDRRTESDEPNQWWRGSLRLRDVRGGLSRPVAALFLAGFYGAVIMGGLSMWSMVSDLDTGTPTENPSSCEYSSSNHGDYRCLTKAQHEEQEERLQRFVAGILGGFFVAHCGLATGEVLLRRQS